jgi:hypothetical protein
MADEDDPVFGSFEDFGDTPDAALTTGGLDLGGQLKLPDSLTDPLGQRDADPDYSQPVPEPVEHDPENLLQRAWDWLNEPPKEPAPLDPVEEQRIEDEKVSEDVLDQTTVDTPDIDF